MVARHEGVPDEEIEQIVFGNAARVFGFAPFAGTAAVAGHSATA